MIRFSAFLVVVAVGLLVAGVVTSKLLLVYIAIGVSGVALLALGVGAVVNWRELTGKPGTDHPEADHPEVAEPGTAEPRTLEPSAQGPAPQAAVPEPVTSPATGAAPGGSGWPATVSSVPSGPSRVGYLPATEPPRARPTAAPARGVWEWRDDSIQVPSAPAPGQPSAPIRPPGQGSRPGQPTIPDRTSGRGGDTPPRPAQASAAAEAPAPPRPDPAKSASRKPVESAAPATSPQPIQKPAPSRAEPAPAASRDQSPDASRPGDQPSAAEQSSAKEQSSAGVQDEAKPAAANQPTPTPTAPGPKPAGDPEPVSEADPAAEPEMTLAPGTTSAASAPARPDPSMGVTVVPGVPRYHNANCILIRFMGDSDLDKMTLAAAREAGCTPCRACLPDQPERSPE